MQPDLQRIADELAIRQLIASYTDALNRADVDEAIRTYAQDSVLTMMDRPSVHGRDAIADMLRSTVARYHLAIQLVHSGVVQIDGDTARTRFQITELQWRKDLPSRLVVGRYEDDLTRLPEGWRFVRRTFTARYLGAPDLTDGVMPDAPPRFPLWP